jgi:peroxiredoxin Q/BCP
VVEAPALHGTGRRAPLGYPPGVRTSALAVLLPWLASLAGAEALAPGAKAPAFSLAGSDGRTHTLAEHVGRRGVVLAWFPKAFTPG